MDMRASRPLPGDTKRKQLWRARNAACVRDHAEDNRRAALAGVDLAGLRKTAVLKYDAVNHGFLPIVLRCLGLCSTGDVEADQAILEGLQPLPASVSSQRRFRGGDRGPSSPWIQLWLSEASEFRAAHADFDAAYVRFLRDVILPHVGDPRGLLFQRRPTFRCHVAGGGEATGVAHRDVDNGHPPSEINFWLPFTRVGGSNSLCALIESSKAKYASDRF